MVDKINMVFNPSYWDGIASVKEWNRVCYGFPTEESFYSFTEPIDGLRETMRFLDFGCGPGRIVKTVAPHVKEYVGVDVSEGLLELARNHHAHYKNVQFVQYDGHSLSAFEDNQFDFAYERLVFIHVEKNMIAQYVKELHRVLKDGGVLVIPDFPKEEFNTNGFSLAETQELFSIFGAPNIDASGILYNIRCVK